MRSYGGNVLFLPDGNAWFLCRRVGRLKKIGNLFLMLLCDPVWFIAINLLSTDSYALAILRSCRTITSYGLNSV